MYFRILERPKAVQAGKRGDTRLSTIRNNIIIVYFPSEPTVCPLAPSPFHYETYVDQQKRRARAKLKK